MDSMYPTSWNSDESSRRWNRPLPPFSLFPPTAETAVPSPLGMGLDYLLLSVHCPGGGEMRSLGPLGRWWWRSSLASNRIDDIHATILIGEPHRRLPGWARCILDRPIRIRRVYIFVQVICAIVFLYPIGHIGLPIISHSGRRVSESEHFVRRCRRV